MLSILPPLSQLYTLQSYKEGTRSSELSFVWAVDFILSIMLPVISPDPRTQPGITQRSINTCWVKERKVESMLNDLFKVTELRKSSQHFILGLSNGKASASNSCLFIYTMLELSFQYTAGSLNIRVSTALV